MTNSKKILASMRVSPLNLRMHQIETVVKRFGVNVRKTGGSHVIFEHQQWIEMLSIPTRNPIKPIYIKKLINLLDTLDYK